MGLGDAARPAHATVAGTILLIDGRDLTRRSMARLLDAASPLAGLDIVEAASMEEAAAHAGKPVRAVVLTPDTGEEDEGSALPGLLRRLKAHGGSLAGAPVAIVLRGGHGGLPSGILDLGVRGCIGPTVSGEDLVMALRLIIGGAVFIAPGVLRAGELARPAPPPALPAAGPASAPSAPSAPFAPSAPSAPSHPAASPAVRGPRLGSLPDLAAGRLSRVPPALPAQLAATPTGFAETALTARETQVLLRLREGKPNKIIAHEMGISENTVKVHVRRILRKLRAANRTEAASFEDVAMTVPSRTDHRPYPLAPSGVPILRPLPPSS